MIIQIIGTGVVGEATAYLAKQLGHEVYGYDIKPHKNPYYISGMNRNANLVFICTSELVVEEVIKDLVKNKMGGLYVIRSTVLPNTTKELSKKYKIHISQNPEFLNSHSALNDTFNPARIVIGECCKEHGDLIEEFYKPLHERIIKTSSTASELIKFASNCWFASNITYWNTIESFAQANKLLGTEIGAIASLDPRISQHGARWHNKFAGACLPKDLKAFIKYGRSLGLDVSYLEAIDKYNEKMNVIYE